MNLLFRVLFVWLSSYFKPRINDILSPADLTLRVLPNDLDFNMHMNNGRYLTMMDLGRLDLILRSGLLKMMLREKSVPILAASTMRYRLSLDPFQKYTLRTQILCWDEKWVYIEQRFLKDEDVAAIGLVKGCFLNQKSKKTIPTSELLHHIGYNGHSPATPQHVVDWKISENTLRDVTKNGSNS
ncbi:MAG: thioesterase family protein [Pseudobdellovibrionaceae bacterium]|jgi:acyl-CoA thioesterase FadM|nr:thioesterase family protein [Pseudobdellovibrionaceae bacterium]